MADVFAPQPVKTKAAGDVVVNINSGQTVGLAAGAAAIGSITNTSFAATQATGSNLHAVLDTGSTTAVTQATGTNLHTVVDSGALTVSQATGTNLHVVVDGTVTTSGGGLVGTVVDNYGTSAAVAAGATITLDSTSVPSGTAHLTEAIVSSSVALKAQLGTWNGTTFTVKRTVFVPANSNFTYFPSRSDELNLATGATATYRWSITNNDNANAADVYASTTYYYA